MLSEYKNPISINLINYIPLNTFREYQAKRLHFTEVNNYNYIKCHQNIKKKEPKNSKMTNTTQYHRRQSKCTEANKSNKNGCSATVNPRNVTKLINDTSYTHPR